MTMDIYAPQLIAGDENVGFIFTSHDQGTTSIQVFFFIGADYSTTLDGNRGTASVNIKDNLPNNQAVQVDAHSINADGGRIASYRQYFKVAPKGTPKPVPTRTPEPTIFGDASGGDSITGGVGDPIADTTREQAAQEQAAQEKAAQEPDAEEQAAQ